jgi:hypothetical protein
MRRKGENRVIASLKNVEVGKSMSTTWDSK